MGGAESDVFFRRGKWQGTSTTVEQIPNSVHRYFRQKLGRLREDRLCLPSICPGGAQLSDSKVIDHSNDPSSIVRSLAFALDRTTMTRSSGSKQRNSREQEPSGEVHLEPVGRRTQRDILKLLPYLIKVVCSSFTYVALGPRIPDYVLGNVISDGRGSLLCQCASELRAEMSYR